ncbi:hypothetical protein Rwratislav_22782, partial [Rhodococcus wratislaviensis IFP 2016]
MMFSSVKKDVIYNTTGGRVATTLQRWHLPFARTALHCTVPVLRHLLTLLRVHTTPLPREQPVVEFLPHEKDGDRTPLTYMLGPVSEHRGPDTMST